ncbi:MAG TPA: hypothetical protein ENJ95_12045 [Bacteroidetes bacterium]|nr:hypothetical protein [Bacteroidota bacterium]
MKLILSAIILLSIALLTSCNKEDKPSEKIKAKWIENAFASLSNDKYPRVKAISWWHENFDNSELRIDSSPESLAAYKKGISSLKYITAPEFISNKLAEPATDIYHSAFPDFGGTEDMVTSQKIKDFELLAGKDIAWAYFSNNWYDVIQFPTDAVNTIHDAGTVPFIRLMPRTNFDEGGPDPNYSMQKIIDGNYDEALTQWAINAANIGFPILVEFGTEVNGNWFPWNGQYNGGGETNNYGDPSLPDGPERFRDAYRHIINICNDNGAENITWFFHIDAYGGPDENWNNIENYYPGDSYIDWLGVSVYGPQESGEDYQEFSEIMDDVYPKLEGLSNKPVAVLEFAVTEF